MTKQEEKNKNELLSENSDNESDAENSSDTDYGTFSLNNGYESDTVVFHMHKLTCVYNTVNVIPMNIPTFLHPLNIHTKTVGEEWQDGEEWRVDETSEDESESDGQPNSLQDTIQPEKNTEKQPFYSPDKEHHYSNTVVCAGTVVVCASIGAFCKYSESLSRAIMTFWNSLVEKIKKTKRQVRRDIIHKDETQINHQQNTKKEDEQSLKIEYNHAQ